MQVSHSHDHVTHAIIGGKESIEFGISSSAEFFNILSSTLYKDQVLAVVREVVCNAWDAHIEAGCTDKPIEISLADGTFSIKDFGPGIHHDDMGPIYGTYGNSTKKNDGKQTGGFGLGCKAPFAYTDHFEVTSCHAGVKTIYSLSKSSAQVLGKPGITTIASFPTDETGLTVSIQIKDQNAYRFRELINRIVYNGDITATLNGKQLPILNFDKSKSNYLIMSGIALIEHHVAIMVRYGNVVYPVESMRLPAYSRIVNHLRTLYNSSHMCIVFQAPPNSLSVTPSRESLSMQEHTIKTLTTLFEDFVKMLDSDFSVSCDKYAQVVVDQAAANKDITALISRDRSLPVKTTYMEADKINSLDQMTDVFMQRNYPSTTAFRTKDIAYRVKAMMKNKLVDPGKSTGYLKELASQSKEANWLQRYIIAPVLKKLLAQGIDHTRLYVCDSKSRNRIFSGRGSNLFLVPAVQAALHSKTDAIAYLRNIVILSSARTNLLERARKHDVFIGNGYPEGVLFYYCSTKVKEVTQAREFFTNLGMKVVDLTVKQEWEEEVIRETKVRKPTKKGLVRLDYLLESPTMLDTSNVLDDAATRTEDPKFSVCVSTRKGENTNQFKGLTRELSRHIINLFGKDGGATNTTKIHEAYLKKGVKTLEQYVLEKVSEYMTSNSRIKEYWAFRIDRLDTGSLNDSLVELLYSIKDLRTEFGLKNDLTSEDRMYMQLWDEFCDSGNTCPVVNDTRNALKAIPVDPANTVLLAKLKKNPLLEMLDVYAIKRALQGRTVNPARSKQVTDMLVSVINS